MAFLYGYSIEEMSHYHDRRCLMLDEIYFGDVGMKITCVFSTADFTSLTVTET